MRRFGMEIRGTVKTSAKGGGKGRKRRGCELLNTDAEGGNRGIRGIFFEKRKSATAQDLRGDGVVMLGRGRKGKGTER